MEPNPLAVVWVVIMNQQGQTEVCAVLRADNVYAQRSPVTVRYDATRAEIIIEVHRAPTGARELWELLFEEKNFVLRFKVGNGLLVVRDQKQNPLLQFVPCATYAEALHEARRLAGTMNVTKKAA